MAQELEINIAGLKKQIGGERRGKKKEDIEVLEHESRLMARSRMTEDKEQWSGQFAWARQAIPRMWKYSIMNAPTYAKEKAFSQQMMAAAGVQMKALPYDFLTSVSQAAQRTVDAERRQMSGIRRLGANTGDFLSEVAVTQKRTHAVQIEIVNDLRRAVFENSRIMDPSNTNAEDVRIRNLINTNRDFQQLLPQFRNVLTGDFQASEGQAKRLSNKMTSDTIRAAVGETRVSNVVITPRLKEYMNKELIFPFLREALTRGDGKISDETKMALQAKSIEWMFTKIGTEWQEELRRNNPDMAQQMRESLTHGIDIMPVMQEVLLPQALQIKEQLQSDAAIEQYVQNLVLKVNVGTLKAGEQGTVNETRVERAVSRSITNQRVQEVYRRIGTQAGGERFRMSHEARTNPNQLSVVPNAYAEAAGARVNALRIATVGGRGFGHVTWGLLVGGGLYGGQMITRRGAGFLLPFIGGAAATAIVRGVQERGRYTREYEQHGIESARGYSFEQAARRRQEMERLMPPRMDIQQAINPMKQTLRDFQANSVTEETINRALRLLAERSGRYSIMNQYEDIEMYRVSTTKDDLGDKKRELDQDAGQVTNALRNYARNNTTGFEALMRRYGFTRYAPIDLDYIIGQMGTNRAANLREGTVLNAQYAAAIGLTSVEQNATITAREGAMNRARWRSIAMHAGPTALLGVGVPLLEHFAIAPGVNALSEHFQHNWKFVGPSTQGGRLGTRGVPGHWEIDDSPVHKTVAGGQVKLNLPVGWDAHDVGHNEIDVVDASGHNHLIHYAIDGQGHVTYANPKELGFLQGQQMDMHTNSFVNSAHQEILRTDNTSDKLLAGHGYPVHLTIDGKQVDFELPSQYRLLQHNGNHLVIADNKGVPHYFTVESQGNGVSVISTDQSFHELTSSDPRNVLRLKVTSPKDLSTVFSSHEFQTFLDRYEFKGEYATVGHHLFPELTNGTGDYAGNELNLHWTDGRDAVTGHWFVQKGALNFGGVLNDQPIKADQFGLESRATAIWKHLYPGQPVPSEANASADPQVAHWLDVIKQPRTDPELLRLIKVGGFDHQIPANHMLMVVRLTNGKELWLPCDDHGNAHLPDYLQTPQGTPNALVQWVGAGVAEQNSNGQDTIFNAQNWNPQHPPQNITMHFFSSRFFNEKQNSAVSFIQRHTVMGGTPGIELTLAPQIHGGINMPDILPPFDTWRKPLERPIRPPIIESWNGYNSISPEANLELEGWLNANMSDTLKNNPDAQLDASKEFRKYFEKHPSRYKNEIQSLTSQITEPPSQNLRAIVCIPVAGHQEGKNIYQALENYVHQSAAKDKFELLLFVNRPEVDQNGKPTSSKETLDAIQRFRDKYPDFPVRVVEKVLPANEVNIGTIRKYLSDIALYRYYLQGTSPQTRDLILISNDIDNKGVAPKYIENFIKKFDENPYADAYMGQLDWDPETFSQYPLIHIGTRLFQYANIESRLKWKVRNSSGANFAYKASIYAGIGGYIAGMTGGEDTALGQAILNSRKDKEAKRIAYAGAVQSRIYTSARRAVKVLEQGLAPIEQWDKGFSAFDDEVRRFELGEAKTINYNDPEVVKTLRQDITTVLERTFKKFEVWESGRGLDREDNKRWAKRLGIKFSVKNGHIEIDDMSVLVRGLNHYQKVALLMRDLKAGRGNRAEIQNKLHQLNAEYKAELKRIEARQQAEERAVRKEKEDKAEEMYNQYLVDAKPIEKVESNAITANQLFAAAHKIDEGKYVMCPDIQVGAGHMGEVIAGYDRSTGKVLVFKTIDKHTQEAMAQENQYPAGVVDPEEYIKSKVSNPTLGLSIDRIVKGDKIIKVYELDDTSLESQLTKEKKFDSLESIGILIRLTKAVQDLHKIGVLHLDIKPSNVLLDKDGEVVLSDFDAVSIADHQGKYHRGWVGGPYELFPPELFKEHSTLTESSDTYMLTILLYKCLTGKYPYQLSNATQEMKKAALLPLHQEGKFKIPDKLPEPIKSILRKGIQPDGKKRYQSTGELLYDLLEVYTALQLPTVV